MIPKKDLRQLFEERLDRLAVFAHPGQRRTEQDGEEHDLQEIALGEGVHRVVGRDVQQKVRRALRLTWRVLRGIGASGADIYARPRPH